MTTKFSGKMTPWGRINRDYPNCSCHTYTKARLLKQRDGDNKNLHKDGDGRVVTNDQVIDAIFDADSLLSLVFPFKL